MPAGSPYTPAIQAALDRQVRATESKESHIARRLEIEARIEGHKVTIAGHNERAILIDAKSAQFGIKQAEIRYRIQGQATQALAHQLEGARHKAGIEQDKARELGASRRIKQRAIVERLKAEAIDVAGLIQANENRLKDLKRLSGRVPSLPQF